MTNVWKFKLDRKGLGQIIRSPETRAMVNDAAERIAAGARARGARKVEVEPYTTDREAAAVVVLDFDALGQEAKSGILSGPAAGIGAEVRGR